MDIEDMPEVQVCKQKDNILHDENRTDIENGNSQKVDINSNVTETGSLEVCTKIVFALEDDESDQEYAASSRSDSGVNNERNRKIVYEEYDSDVSGENDCVNDETGTEYKYNCSLCQKQYMMYKDYKAHYDKHASEEYQCQLCHKFYEQKSSLKRHEESHSLQRNFKCSVCGGCFKSKSDLQRHAKIHTSEKKYKCNDCEKVFRTKTFLKCHKFSHSKDRNFACDTCKKTFKRKAQLELHDRITHRGERSYQCEMCEESFFYSQDRRHHMYKVHNQEQKLDLRWQNVPCPICKKEILQQNVQKHINAVHKKEKFHQCKTCKLSFNAEGKLRQHEKEIHMKVKPYSCTVCLKTFARRAHVESHMSVHSGAMFPCGECDRSFTQEPNLKRHIKREHRGEKPFVCQICNEGFNHGRQLSSHKTKQHGHKKIDPKKCDVCGEYFARLDLHKLVHTGEKPYCCPVCDKGFSQRSNLKKHVMLHSDDRPFECEECGKTFKQDRYLKWHMKTHS